jgi:glycosyltransferase involved in cell wall biosynthesis
MTILPLISIIVPVYNSSEYLEKCISSILGQSFKSFELIAVNDGSTDQSASILKRLSEIDERLIYCERNRAGVSSARNFGLSVARGKYIAFSDSDDYMEPEMLEKMYDSITEKKCDWAICDVNVIQENGKKSRRLDISADLINLGIDRSAYMRQMIEFKFDYANWNKLYVFQIIKEHNLTFSDDMSLWEDLLFNLQYLKYANQIILIGEPLYNYRVVQTSLCNSGHVDIVPAYNRLNHYYREFLFMYGTSDELSQFSSIMAEQTYFQILARLERILKKDRLNLIEFMRSYAKDLSRLDPNIFRDEFYLFDGTQGFKKILLRQRCFKSFAFLVAVRGFFGS